MSQQGNSPFIHSKPTHSNFEFAQMDNGKIIGVIHHSYHLDSNTGEKEVSYKLHCEHRAKINNHLTVTTVAINFDSYNECINHLIENFWEVDA